MRTLLLGLSMLLPFQSALADNVADCEVFLRQPVMLDGEETGAFIDTYVPASGFMESVYDEKDGFQAEVDGQPIKAVFCTRHTVVPTLRDFPIVATGLPFVVSTDFDSSDSSIVTIYFKGGKFHHVYSGPELSEKEKARLKDSMEIFNLQPHNLNN